MQAEWVFFLDASVTFVSPLSAELLDEQFVGVKVRCRRCNGSV